MSDRAEPYSYEFGPFCLEPKRRRLTRAGSAVPVAARVFDALMYFVEHPGELVSRPTLMKVLWPRTVVEDNSLNQVIAALRRALGDEQADERYVVTVPGRGYQFVADVRSVAEETTGADETVVPAAGTPSAAAGRSASGERTAVTSDDRARAEADGASTPGARTGRPAAVALIAGGVVAILAAFIVLWTPRPGVDAPEMRLEITTPPTPDPWSIALSPDGRAIVFAAPSNGRVQLWLRSLDSDRASPLPRTEGASFPFWSPDNRSLAFFADGELKTLEINGGLVRTLAPATTGHGGTWSREGTILFAPHHSPSGLAQVAAAGGPVSPVTRPASTREQSHSFPQFLPDGRAFLYYVQGMADTRGVYVARLGSAERRRLLDADAPAVYTPSGYLLFVRQATLFAQAFDVARLEVSGAPFAVAEPVMVDAGPNHAALSVSAAGPIAYRLSNSGAGTQLTWFDRSGRQEASVGDAWLPPARSVSLSPDRRRAAFYWAAEGNTDVWLLDLDRGVPSRFSFDSSWDNSPIWSPDGASIVFASNRSGIFHLYRKASSGAGAEELLLATDSNAIPTDWSSDARNVLYRRTTADSSFDVMALPLDAHGEPFAVAATSFDERDGQFSPDGKWVAYQSNESGQFEIYVQAFPTAAGKWLVSTGGGAQVRWSSNATELFYISLDNRLMAVPIDLGEDGRTASVGPAEALFETRLLDGAVQPVDTAQYVVADGGQRFLLNTMTQSQNPSIAIMLNWTPPR